MASLDLKVLYDVRQASLATGGGSAIVRTVLSLLDQLAIAFGDSFSIEETCVALDKLSSEATFIKETLTKEKISQAATV